MNAAPCADAPRVPVITWRVVLAGSIGVTFTVIDGAWHWRLDAANARNSRGFPSYPAAMAHARAHLGLPAIGEAGQHLQP